MAQFKVALIVGSTRRESINRKLGQALAKLGKDKLDFQFVQIDDLPLYNQDNETNLPPSVVRFKSEIAAADGLLFVTPEHSRSIPAALKNAIDWGARPWGKNNWTGKLAAVTGASPGAISTALAQQHLRQILGAQGVLLMALRAESDCVHILRQVLETEDTILDRELPATLAVVAADVRALADKLLEIRPH